MRIPSAALAALLAVLPLPAGAQSFNMDMPSLFGRRRPPPDDSLPPPPFLAKPSETAKPASQGSGVRAKGTACRTVPRRVTAEGRTTVKRERVCG
jgi:hypothetical protein